MYIFTNSKIPLHKLIVSYVERYHRLKNIKICKFLFLYQQ